MDEKDKQEIIDEIRLCATAILYTFGAIAIVFLIIHGLYQYRTETKIESVCSQNK